MDTRDDSPGLNIELRDRVLERLGCTAPPRADLAALRTLYGAWCARVPFDNLHKLIALRSSPGMPLPGGHAQDFFERWLADGAGATCWPTSNALYELARALGFEARRVAGCMRDLGVVNHGSVKVRLDGRDWLVDSSQLYNNPLPLDRAVFVQSDPVYATEVELCDEGQHVLWAATPPNSAYMPCRILPDEVTHEFYLRNYESSRERSPFNQRLYARRNRPGELVVLIGNTRFSKTAQGLAQKDLDRHEITRALREDIGVSQRLIDACIACGGLAAGFEPPSGPNPPALTGKPPSQR